MAAHPKHAETGRTAALRLLPAPPTADESAERLPESSVRTLQRGNPLAPATRPSRRPWLLPLTLIGVLAAISAFIPMSRARWLVPVGGLLALSALLRAVSRGRVGNRNLIRRPLLLLAAGLILTIISETLVAAGGSTTSLATPVALAGYPFLLAGLVVLNGSRLHEHALDTILAAAIVPSTLLAFGWMPLVDVVEAWTGATGGTAASSWLVLGVDALAVAIIARLAVRFRGRPVAYQMLLAAMACMLGAHVARVIAAVTISDPAPFGAQALLLISFALLAGAALHPSMRPASGAKARADSMGVGHLVMLVVVVLVGPAFAVLRYGGRGTWVLLVAAGPAVVSLLVVAHLARMLRERQRLEYLSTHDALTGLPNRTAFHEGLAELLTRTTATDGPGVIFLDLDRFKNVNDTYGHDAGDELLREVALRLRLCVRSDDTVARLAGDEFAILLAAPCGAARAEAIARRILESFADPFYATGKALSVSPSMGIALAPEHGSEVEVLLRNADSAMYAAKAGGRGTSRMFAPRMASAADRHLLLEQRFHRSIADGELVVHYQPRVDTTTRRLVGAEALVRWKHPELGLIPPAAFITVAESTGSIADLGSWVLNRACDDAATWWRAGSPLVVSVNVSPRQFALQDVPGMVAAALQRSGLPPQGLELELTESLHLSDDGSVTEALGRIHELGVICAVDDFGTGYSSISVLRDYPIGVVKLDQSFVNPVGGFVDMPLVRGVVQLARGLGMRVVAEGVETEEQMEFLLGISCDEIQGFLVSRAVPSSHILKVIRDGGGAPARVASLLPSILDLNERRLVELLWAEQEKIDRLRDLNPRDPRIAAVLGNAALVMAVPIVLGLGSGGGLPPMMQSSFSSTLAAMGAQPPLLNPRPATADTVFASAKLKGNPTTVKGGLPIGTPDQEYSPGAASAAPERRSGSSLRIPVDSKAPVVGAGTTGGDPVPASGTPAVTPNADDNIPADPQANPPDEPVTKPTKDPAARPTKDPVTKPTKDPAARPTKDPAARPTPGPVTKPTKDPVAKDPVAKRTEDPVGPSVGPGTKPPGQRAKDVNPGKPPRALSPDTPPTSDRPIHPQPSGSG